MILSNFEFGDHLQDLFDVITSLNLRDSQDLLHFQLFIHHRAYRKVGWRVLEFSTHWGASPFKIISNSLTDPELESKTFVFKQHLTVHTLIQNRIMPEPQLSSGTSSKPVYCVNSSNALQWLKVLQDFWFDLEDELLVKSPPGKTKRMMVREDSPSYDSVRSIVLAMSALEALMPVLKHLLSATGVAQALASAGKFKSSFTSDCCVHAFPEDQSDLPKSSGDISLEPDADDHDLELVLTNDEHESCHLQ